MAKLPRSHPGIPAELDRYLTPAEKIVFRTRLHWVRITNPWVLFFVSLLALGLLDASLPDRTPLVRDILVILPAILFVRALWRACECYREWFVVTDRRLMLSQGILTRKTAMIPVSKVTDMRYARSPFGQLLGYGSFVL